MINMTLQVVKEKVVEVLPLWNPSPETIQFFEKPGDDWRRILVANIFPSDEYSIRTAVIKDAYSKGRGSIPSINGIGLSRLGNLEEQAAWEAAQAAEMFMCTGGPEVCYGYHSMVIERCQRAKDLASWVPAR